MFINPAPLAPAVETLRKGETDLFTYVDEMCDRVEKLDAQVEAILPEPERRRRLHTEAKELQQRFASPDDRPPLYGALVGLKDIIHVSGFVTKAGSEVPPELFAGPEATCASWLRDAGALILGKSVTTEFAYFEPGPTRNPHNLEHTPGGSSSGSAAGVAAGFCALALGSQTIGSVIRPAAFCGVIGFKPTLNRIPTKGLVYFSRFVDQIGLFTQDMAGMALAGTVLCQAWRKLPERGSLPVLGVPEGAYLEQAEPKGLEAFDHHLSKLEGMGCTIKRVPTLSHIDELNDLHLRLISAEFAKEHEQMYDTHAALYRPRTAEIIEIGKKVSEEELISARSNCTQLRAQLEAQMARESIDLWVCPSAPGPAPEGIQATGDPNMNLPWTHAGMPVVTLPSGRAENGLPLGLQFVAPFGADEYLIAWCEELVDRMGDPLAE
jgi:Asp-tRNA(Asn)/Glu-tRNA(Gln) amidotransferase A subunit family amidase